MIMATGQDDGVSNDQMNEDVLENSILDVMVPNNYVQRYNREQEDQETEQMSLLQGGDLSEVHPNESHD